MMVAQSAALANIGVASVGLYTLQPLRPRRQTRLGWSAANDGVNLPGNRGENLDKVVRIPRLLWAERLARGEHLAGLFRTGVPPSAEPEAAAATVTTELKRCFKRKASCIAPTRV